MRLRSLAPFRESGALMRPDFGLFGLHREIDRLFSEFAQGASGAQNIIPNIEISETDKAIEVSAEMPGLERKDVEISSNTASAVTGCLSACCSYLPASIRRAYRPRCRKAC